MSFWKNRELTDAVLPASEESCGSKRLVSWTKNCLPAFSLGGTKYPVSYLSEGVTKLRKENIIQPPDPSDPEDFNVSSEAMKRRQRARLIRKTRTSLGLSQPEFADRFHMPIGTLRDWEQARATAPDFAVAYVQVIGQYPDVVAKALA